VISFSLAGRHALVTGANTGIGQAIAIALAAAGARVTCAARRDCDETLAAIRTAGGRADALALDFDDPMAATRGLFNAADYDILVNNAGMIRRADATDTTEADWDDVLSLNLKAAFFTSQAFARAALSRKAPDRGARAKIVNIASLLSFQGGIRVPAYAASKHALAGITKALANEWAAHGINVNAIAPGYITTNNTTALRDDPDRSAAILARIPAGRWGDPADVAGAAVFLCAPASDYIHGTILTVDGGWLAR
jgi:2-deoxy-D-gluconate 3-dehydrogenase